MGSRRVRDLLSLGHEVVGFDVRPDRNERATARFKINTVASLEQLLAENLWALVVSTPPDQHSKCYSAAFDAGLPFFSEASILTPTRDWFANRERRTGVRGYASATWRFYAPLTELERRLKAATPVVAIHHQYADYLPRWHPWESYWEFYAGARRQTSAAREMVPFEFEWLCWLFGEVESVSAMVERFGKWRTDIDDAYFLHVKFAAGPTATVRIELHRKAPARTAVVCGTDECYKLDFNTNALSRYEEASEVWSLIPVPESSAASRDLERVYAAEIAAFASAVSGKCAYPKSWAEDRHLSDVLVAAERSAKEKRWVSVAEIAAAYTGLSLD